MGKNNVKKIYINEKKIISLYFKNNILTVSDKVNHSMDVTNDWRKIFWMVSQPNDIEFIQEEKAIEKKSSIILNLNNKDLNGKTDAKI